MVLAQHQNILDQGYDNSLIRGGINDFAQSDVPPGINNALTNGVETKSFLDKIGGWTITDTALFSGAVSERVGLDNTITGADDVRIYAGSETLASAPFRVTESGAMTATSATITGAITATSGAIGGFTITSTAIKDAAGTFGLDSTVTGGDDIRLFIGNVTPSSAPFRVTESGATTASSITITGGSISSTPISAIPNDTSTDISLLEKTHDLVFSVTDADTIAWATGTITYSNGRAFSIDAGNTGNMAALTYIYLDTGASSTVLQVTTTYSTAIGANKSLLGTAQNNTVTAMFIPYGSGQPLIDGENIGALSIIAGNIAATTITAAKMNVSQLSAIVADIGAITAGSISVVNGANTIGLTPAGANAIFSGTTGSPEFKVTPAGALTATSATISGAITATSGSITGAFTVGTSGTFSSGQTAYATGTGYWLEDNSGNPRVSIGKAEALLTYDGTAFDLVGVNSTTALMTVTADTLANGGTLLKLTSNSGDAFNRNILEIVNDHVDAVGARGLKIQQDAAAPALEVDHNGNSKALSLNCSGTTTDDCVSMVSTGATTGSVAVFSDGSADTGTRNCFEIINSNAAATGATLMFLNQNSAGGVIDINAETTTANVIDITATELTTGSGIRVYSNSELTDTRTLVDIINDHADSVNVTPLNIQQDAVTETNFKKCATFGGKTIFISDGTTAEGNLTGVQGDICLDGSTVAGGMAFCDANGTNWTDM